MKQLTEKLDLIRKRIYLKDPFLGYILQKTTIHIISDEHLPTASTDGKDIYIGENFLRENLIDDLVFVIAHEILHIFLEHPKMISKPNRNKKAYNIAADITVNGILLQQFDEPKITKPILGDENFNHLTLSTEQMYEKIMKEKKVEEIEKIIITNHSFWDEYKELDDNTRKEIYNYLKNNVDLYKYEYHLERKINLVSKNNNYKKRNWKNILKKSISKTNDDYSYKRIDTRIKDVILPKFFTTDYYLDNIWIMIDVSASVSSKELEMIYNQVIDIISSFNKYKILVSFFSTKVDKTYLANNKKEIQDSFKNIKSTGGTSFDVIFDYIKKSKYNPKTLLIITDGFSNEPDKNPIPQTEVYWLKIHNLREEKFKFGKEICIQGGN